MITFFATYYQQFKSASVLISSLLNQTCEEWELVICSNGDETVYDLDIKDSRIRVECSEASGYWGCYNRETFRKEYSNHNGLLINTSVEDYYAPVIVEILSELKEDFIYWDCSHHSFGYEVGNVVSTPKVFGIDWGSFAVRGYLANSFSIPHPKSITADGEYVELLMSKSPSVKHIDKVLFMKN